MDRRQFLLAAAATTATAAAGAAVSGSSPDATSAASVSLRHVNDAAQASLAEVRDALGARRISSRDLVRFHLRRIAALDRKGPSLHAVITTNPDALRIAAERDDELRKGSSRGPLHGVPILLKDNLDTADQQPTTAGSLALDGTIAPRDAFVVRRLREAGAVLLGKTNLSEWANFRSNRSASGWSAVGGQTRNPYVLNRTPSGSSAGSGTAIAAGYAAAALGTETDGSIVSPSTHCSLVGLKPTLGLVSRTGIIPIAHSQDTAGPMTRTVTDAAILLGVIAGEDPADAATAASRGHVHSDYTRFLDRDSLRGKRVGVARQAFGAHAKVDRLIEQQLDVLRGLGAIVVDPVNFPTWRKFGGAEQLVLLHEFKADLAAYLATRGEGIGVRNLADLIAFNERYRAQEMPFFGQEVFLEAQSRGPLTDPAYLEALATCRRLARTEGVDAVMDEHRLDVVVAPTSGMPASPIDPLLGDRGGGGCSSMPAVAGTPHLTVPAGYVHGLPVGLSFFGRAWSEPALLGFGFAYEQATKHRRAPRFLADVEPSRPG
jgi:amidase